jgi:RNase P subunit RPR2
MTAKILTIDIETAPFESLTWGIWDQNIGLNQIQKETSILSYAAKWLHSPKILYNDTSGRGAKATRNDLKLLGEIWKLLDEADIVVAQNGAAFDVKRINARMVVAGLPPYSPIRIIDTKLVAKKHFAFSSNRLEWLAKYLAGTNKYKHSKYEGMELWIECLKDNPDAWKEMKKYNIIDTKLCEGVYLKLRGWMNQHPNLGVYTDAERPICNNCGSEHVNKHKERVTQQGRYMQYQCQDCGAYTRGKTMLLTVKKRRSLLA